MRAIMNVVLSLAFCTGAVAVGHVLAAWLNGGDTRIVQLEIEEEA